MPEILHDFRSDTVTKPSPGMYEAMVSAPLGDDMSGGDPTVNRLEDMCCKLFGKEAAVYMCSGTQSNQAAVRTHCRPGDELLINASGHIANYEAGAPAVLSGVTSWPIRAPHGFLDVCDLEDKIRADDQHLTRTRLVCVENTTNMGGGRAYPLEQLARVGEWSRENGLKTHMDGARFFNACVARGCTAVEVAQHVDTVSVCFSKGLGCPMGSILVGSKEEIAVARRARKLFGGALRQAGVVAATAIYAIENNIERLAEDHDNAKLFAELATGIEGVLIDPDDVETNLVFFELDPDYGTAAQLSAALEQRGVKIYGVAPQRLRACMHLDVDRENVIAAVEILRDCVAAGVKETVAATADPYSRT